MKQARFIRVSVAASLVAGLTTSVRSVDSEARDARQEDARFRCSHGRTCCSEVAGVAQSIRFGGWRVGGGFHRAGSRMCALLDSAQSGAFAINNATISRDRPYRRVFTVPGDDQEKFRAGDIIVTAVARQYVIGRVRADGQIQDALAWAADWSDALATAFGIAGPHRRVFVFQDPSSNEYRRCLRETESPGAKPLMKPTTGIPGEFTTRGSWRYHTSRK